MEVLVPGTDCKKIGDPQILADDEVEPVGCNPPKIARVTPTAVNLSAQKYNGNNSNDSVEDQPIHPITSLSPYQNK